MKEILVTRRTCLYGRMLLHRLQETNAGTQVFRLWLSGLHGHGNLPGHKIAPKKKKAEKPEK